MLSDTIIKEKVAKIKLLYNNVKVKGYLSSGITLQYDPGHTVKRPTSAIEDDLERAYEKLTSHDIHIRKSWMLYLNALYKELKKI